MSAELEKPADLFDIARGSAKVQKRKGSYVVTIPSDVAESAEISKGDKLDFAHRDGQPIFAEKDR